MDEKDKQHGDVDTTDCILTCEVCGQTFHDVVSHHKHTETAHFDDSTIYADSLSSPETSSQVPAPQVQPFYFYCSVTGCGAAYVDYYHLQHHMTTVHTSYHYDMEQNRNHFCPTCNRNFASMHMLNRHLERMPSHRPVIFRCNVCFEVFPDQMTLTEHWPMHSFPCNYCGSYFWSGPDLCQHIDQYHTTKFACFTCVPPCGRVYQTGEELNCHINFRADKATRALKRGARNNWAFLQPTDEILGKLRAMRHKEQTLRQHGFVLDIPTAEDIENLRKCLKCRQKKGDLGDQVECYQHQCPKTYRQWDSTSQTLVTYATCCDSPISSRGCVKHRKHRIEDYSTTAQRHAFLPTPSAVPGDTKYQAVAIDCEMGISRTNENELLQISVVDYFSGTIILDTLVRPRAALKHYNTKFSGVTEEMMNMAVAEGEFLDGWEAARAALWELIDANTVIVGHGLTYDLFQLKVIHYNIVDSSVVVPRLKGSKHGLKALALELTGKRVQSCAEIGHDCVEDALAARELVIWCNENQDALEERRKIKAKEDEEREDAGREKKD